MLLSIIIPSFQQGPLLKSALESIAQQTFRDFEVLIIDGNSKDNTANIVSKFKNIPIRFFSEHDDGIYDAMNKGIDKSLGKYLYFMGCDDRLASPTVLEEIFAIPGIANKHVIYGDVIFTGNRMRYDGEFTHFKLISKNICHQAIFVQKNVFNLIGKFNVRYKILADWEFNMRWFNKIWIERKYVNIVVAYYNNLGSSYIINDDSFFAEELSLKKMYFPKTVRYLHANLSRPLHYRTTNLLTFERVNLIEKIINFLHL